MMIDWISAFTATPMGLSPQYDSGRNLKINPSGEIISDKASMFQVLDEDASSSKNFTVWTPDRNQLYISGNPAKLLQGHNLFGSDDVLGLYFSAGEFVRQTAGLFPSPGSYGSLQFTLPRFTRLDITRSYRFDSVNEARSYIRHVAGSSRSRHGAAKLVEEGTAYFGKNSTRWTMKIYDKATEYTKGLSGILRGILRRNDHVAFRNLNDSQISDLKDWSQGVVRFELTLRSPELVFLNKLLLINHDPKIDWHLIWQEYFDRITFNENATMITSPSLLEDALSPLLKGVLALWRQGQDLRRIYPQNTFYRHRRALLEALSVDIAAPPPSDISEPVKTSLDPSKWDPKPIEAYLVEPDPACRQAYLFPHAH